jgi:hypothetical protein
MHAWPAQLPRAAALADVVFWLPPPGVDEVEAAQRRVGARRDGLYCFPLFKKGKNQSTGQKQENRRTIVLGACIHWDDLFTNIQ